MIGTWAHGPAMEGIPPEPRAPFPDLRAGESASTGMTESLQRLGYELGRLKTGTPARIDKRTVDFSALEEQAGEAL